MNSVMHIKGVQPSKAAKKVRTPLPRLSGLLKNVQKIITTKRKNTVFGPSLGFNNIMDVKSFDFFLKYCINTHSTQQRLQINTRDCNEFLRLHKIDFIVERTQEITNSKVFITFKNKIKRHNATFVIQIPKENVELLVLLLLIKIDFGPVQVEINPMIGKLMGNFMYKAKESGFRFYYDFIRLNLKDRKFVIVRN